MKTVQNAIRVLNEFTAGSPEHSLTELSKRVGIDKVIVHRLLKSMKEMDFVEQDADTKRYRIGAGVSRLAAVRRAHLKPLNFAREILLGLHSELNETIHLAQLDGDLIFVTFVANSTQDLRVVMEPGEMLPAYCTAPGLIFLAFGDEDYRAMALSGRLRPRASRTLTSRSDIEALLPDIRASQLATVDETYSDQAKGIAAPVFNAEGKVVAAISVLGPRFRLDGKAEAKARERLKATALQISRDQGYLPDPAP